MLRHAVIILVQSIFMEISGSPTLSITDEAGSFQVKQPIKAAIPSYAGFLNGTSDSRLFFWLFPSERRSTDPVIVWIDGDLTTTSVRGLFENNGPVYVKAEKGLNTRKHYWSQKYNVLYLDNSVYVGFSHTSTTSKKPPNLDETINNLYESLNNFFLVFDRFKTNDLYISGSDLSCKLITKLSLKIASAKKYNLKGLIIENGFCDPFICINVAQQFLNLLIVDKKVHDLMVTTEKQILSLMRINKFDDAFDKYDTYIKNQISNDKTIFNNYTLYETNRNLLSSTRRNYGNYVNHINKFNIMYNINVGNAVYQKNAVFINAIKGELMKTSATDLGTILNEYKVLMYFGQMNPEISPKASLNLASSLKWCNSIYFKDLSYEGFYVNGQLAGYYIESKSNQCKGMLTYALIRNAGKDIADDKPEETLNLIERFITDSLN